MDRKRREVVLAVRGTVSLADAITDIVVAPEAVDNWIPPAEREVLTLSVVLSDQIFILLFFGSSILTMAVVTLSGIISGAIDTWTSKKGILLRTLTIMFEFLTSIRAYTSDTPLAFISNILKARVLINRCAGP